MQVVTKDNEDPSIKSCARNDSIEILEVLPPPNDHETTIGASVSDFRQIGSDGASVIEETESSKTSFFVVPALQRSQSFIHRRTQKRQKQQQRWEERTGEQLTKVTNNDQNDSNEDEEEIVRRSSNYGKFRVFPSSLQDTCSCYSYRRDRLIQEIDASSKRGSSAVLNTLRNAGILVYIVDAKVCITLHEMVDSVHQVIDNVCRDPEFRDHPKNQKAILYRDVDGRLFNLTLTSDFVTMEGSWKDLLHSFSIFQAMVLLSFLTRSFSCAVEFHRDQLQDFRPAYLALVLGLVFSEEIGLSWTNVALLVRGIPSISAYTMTSRVDADWPRKIIILLLAMASYSTSTFQLVCTLSGITLTCLVVLANLGSRSWKNLHWKPTMGMETWFCRFLTPFDPIMAYTAAVFTGIFFPYLGHRQIKSGGSAAIQSVLRIAILVAILFIISDYDDIQKFLIVGSEDCNQEYVNFSVGAWFTISLIASLSILLRKELRETSQNEGNGHCLLPDDEEPLLHEDHASPIGYKVPHLPDFPIDPSLTFKGWVPFCCCSVGFVYLLGVFVAIGVGAFIAFLGKTDLDEKILTNPFQGF